MTRISPFRKKHDLLNFILMAHEDVRGNSAMNNQRLRRASTTEAVKTLGQGFVKKEQKTEKARVRILLLEC